MEQNLNIFGTQNAFKNALTQFNDSTFVMVL